MNRAPHWLAGDERTLEYRLWSSWFRQVPRFRNAFSNIDDSDDPLLYNETASVGVLSSAASRSGLLALAEYVTSKRGTGRGRPLRNGRCDLWVQDPVSERSWSFEFKQYYCRTKVQRRSLVNKLRRACVDAYDVHSFQADRRFGGLLVIGHGDCEVSDGARNTIEELAGETTFACRLGGGLTPAWLLLVDVCNTDWRRHPALDA